MNELTPVSTTGTAFQPFASPAGWLRQEIDRLFENFEEPARNVFNLGLRGIVPNPALEMTEDDKAYHLAVELPGIDEKDVEISVADGILTIAGEKKESHESKSNGCLMSERRYGKFTRRVSLPADVAQEKINAVFKRGVMHITMNKDKNAAPRTRKIAISVAKD
jgi:HSP20 family protein